MPPEDFLRRVRGTSQRETSPAAAEFLLPTKRSFRSEQRIFVEESPRQPLLSRDSFHLLPHSKLVAGTFRFKGAFFSPNPFLQTTRGEFRSIFSVGFKRNVPLKEQWERDLLVNSQFPTYSQLVVPRDAFTTPSTLYNSPLYRGPPPTFCPRPS